MTVLNPTTPHRQAGAQVPTHRHHTGVQEAHKLFRPIPHSTWDPLALDVEASPPTEDYDLPPAQPLPPPPTDSLCTVAGVVTKAVAEVLLGIRSAQQLQRWLVEDVWHVVRRRASLGKRALPQETLPRGVRILRVHPCQINDRVCEVSVVMHDGVRVRAAALRLTLHQNRWRAAAIRIG